MTDSRSRPVVFADDGSDLAKSAIEEAGRGLGKGRDALVVTVWRPGRRRVRSASRLEIDAAPSGEVRNAAEETAAPRSAGPCADDPLLHPEYDLSFTRTPPIVSAP